MQKSISILAIMEKVRARALGVNDKTQVRNAIGGNTPAAGSVRSGNIGDIGDKIPPIIEKSDFSTSRVEEVPKVPKVPISGIINPSLPPLLVLDFETYYDSDYNLKKLHIPEYVLDRRFKIHGLAVKHPDGRDVFETDADKAIRDMKTAYGENFEKAFVVMHNSAFDAFILFYKFGIMPANLIDTMLLARLLLGPAHPANLRELAVCFGLETKGDIEFLKGVKNINRTQLEELSEYARTDARITWDLARIFLSSPFLPMSELPVMHHTVRNFVCALLEIDGAMVDKALEKFNLILSRETDSTGYSLEDYSGRKSFAGILSTALEKHGRTLPTKPDKNGKPIPAVSKDDVEMQALLIDPVEEIRNIAKTKSLVSAAPNVRSKLEFLSCRASLPEKKLYPELAYHGAQTGRFAGAGGFNIQNLGHAERSLYIPSEIIASISEAIKIPDGNTLIATDASQIEARILAYLAGEKDLHDSFARGLDVYSEFSSSTFAEKVEKTKGSTPKDQRMKALRQIGKMAILGLGYGMGTTTFEQNLRSEPSLSGLFDSGLLSPEKCIEIVGDYRRKYPFIPHFWKEAENAFKMAIDNVQSEVAGIRFFKSNDAVLLRLPSGRCMIYPDARINYPEGRPQIAYDNSKKLYGGKIVENIVQAVARDILCHAMLLIEKQGFPVICHIHDSLICIATNETAEHCESVMEAAWRSTPSWVPGLILDAESKRGHCFGDVI